MNIHKQEAEKVSNNMNSKKSTIKHIIIKMLKF